MERVKKIYRSNKAEFEKHCYVFAVRTANDPEILATALTEGIHHFEVSKNNGWVSIKTILNNQISKFNKRQGEKAWQ